MKVAPAEPALPAACAAGSARHPIPPVRSTLSAIAGAAALGLALLTGGLLNTDGALSRRFAEAVAQAPRPAAMAPHLAATGRAWHHARLQHADRLPGQVEQEIPAVRIETAAIDVGTIVNVVGRDGRASEFEIVELRPLVDAVPVGLSADGGGHWYVALGRSNGADGAPPRAIRLLVEAVAPEPPRLVPARAL